MSATAKSCAKGYQTCSHSSRRAALWNRIIWRSRGHFRQHFRQRELSPRNPTRRGHMFAPAASIAKAAVVLCPHILDIDGSFGVARHGFICTVSVPSASHQNACCSCLHLLSRVGVSGVGACSRRCCYHRWH